MSNILFYVFKICAVCFIVLSSCSTTEARRRAKRFIEYGPDIAGPYCATRRDGCCPGRIDECSVPILDTLCYCDRFCNRTRSDCCPDYFSFCLGQVETTPAPLRGKYSSAIWPYCKLEIFAKKKTTSKCQNHYNLLI